MRHELSCILGGEVDRDDGAVAGIDAGAPRKAGLVAGLDLDVQQGPSVTMNKANCL